MQLSYYPAAALRITGSEESSTHKGTMCLDQALNSTNPINDPWMYAPFDCKIWRIYAASNGLFLTSVDPVQTPTFVDHVSFYIGHMNDEDFLPMKYMVGQTIKQGQKFYREGVKGFATGEHVHLNFGRGTFIGNGWAKNTDENWGLTTTKGETHIWDTTYLKTGTQKFEGTSAASGYPWVYEPIPATMKAVADMSVISGPTNVNIRWKPSTKFIVVGKIPPSTKVKISEKSVDEADGFFWVKLADGTGYSAIVAGMQLIDDAAEATKAAAALEAARLEAARLAAEKLAAEKLAAEQEAARLAAIKEAERLAAEKLVAELEAARLAAEVEAQRLAAEEAARLAKLAEEATAKATAEKKEADRLAAEEAARLLAIKEAIRLSAEKLAAEVLEAERLAKEAAARQLEADEAIRRALEEEAKRLQLEADRAAAAAAAKRDRERELAKEAVRQEKLKEALAEQALINESIAGKPTSSVEDVNNNVPGKNRGIIIDYLIKAARALVEYLRSK